MDKPLTAAMTNLDAYSLGLIAREVGTQINGVGDEIDRGLILRRRLEEEGYALIKNHVVRHDVTPSEQTE